MIRKISYCFKVTHFSLTHIFNVIPIKIPQKQMRDLTEDFEKVTGEIKHFAIE